MVHQGILDNDSLVGVVISLRQFPYTLFGSKHFRSDGVHSPQNI